MTARLAAISKLASLNSAIHFVRGDGRLGGAHLFQWLRDMDAYHREIVD